MNSLAGDLLGWLTPSDGNNSSHSDNRPDLSSAPTVPATKLRAYVHCPLITTALGDLEHYY